MSRRLRVGIDVTPLLGSPSGIYQATRGLIDGLSRRGEVELRGWTLSARARRPDVDFPVRRSRFPAGLAQRSWARTNFPRAGLIAGPVDVVHGTNYLVPPSPASIVTINDLSPIIHPEWVEPEVARMAPAVRRAVNEGATITTAAQSVANEIVHELGADVEQVVVIPHGVADVGEPNPSRALELAGSKRFVLALGTVEHRKNVPSLVALLPSLPEEVALVIAGPTGNAESELGRAIEASDSRHRIRRITDLDAADRAALLHDAAVLAFPSHYEGYGFPPLEALKVATPVVATAVGALPELVSDLVDLVPPRDGVAFAEALSSALDEATGSSAARDRVASLTWDRAAAEMTDLYEQVAVKL